MKDSLFYDKGGDGMTGWSHDNLQFFFFNLNYYVKLFCDSPFLS